MTDRMTIDLDIPHSAEERVRRQEEWKLKMAYEATIERLEREISLLRHQLKEARATISRMAERERELVEALRAVQPHIHTLNWNSEHEYEWLEMQIEAVLAKHT